MSANTNQPTKKYIVTNEQGEEFLLPKYAATFRILMDDKDTIRDVLNSLLQLDHDHEITDLEYEFEKPIDIFMPENDPARLDVWVHTRDNRYLNIGKRASRMLQKQTSLFLQHSARTLSNIKIPVVPGMYPDIKASGIVFRHKDVDGFLEFVFKVRDFVIVIQLKQAVEHITNGVLVIHQNAEGRRVFGKQEFFALFVRDNVLLGRLIGISRHVFSFHVKLWSTPSFLTRFFQPFEYHFFVKLL